MFDALTAQSASLRRSDSPLRRLDQAESVHAAGFVAALPEQARYRRFHRAMSPAMVHAHYRALDWNSAIVLAWIEDGAMLGIAEVHPYQSPDGPEAEIALTLDSDADHIGQPLMVSALSRAAAAGARRSWMLLCLPDSAQFGIARRLGARFDIAQDTFVFTH